MNYIDLNVGHKMHILIYVFLKKTDKICFDMGCL